MSSCEGEANLTLVAGQIQTFMVHEVNWKSHNFKNRKGKQMQEDRQG